MYTKYVSCLASIPCGAYSRHWLTRLIHRLCNPHIIPSLENVTDSPATSISDISDSIFSLSCSSAYIVCLGPQPFDDPRSPALHLACKLSGAQSQPLAPIAQQKSGSRTVVSIPCGAWAQPAHPALPGKPHRRSGRDPIAHGHIFAPEQDIASPSSLSRISSSTLACKSVTAASTRSPTRRHATARAISRSAGQRS